MTKTFLAVAFLIAFGPEPHAAAQSRGSPQQEAARSQRLEQRSTAPIVQADQGSPPAEPAVRSEPHPELQYFFEDIPIGGSLPLVMLVAKLRALGDIEEAEAIEQRMLLKKSNGPEEEGEPLLESVAPVTKEPWQFTAHTYGFVPLEKLALGEPARITAASRMDPDFSLRGSRITITIDAARIVNYPGSGIRHLFLDFHGINQAGSVLEHVHVNQAFDILARDAVREINLPVFVNLNVGPQGVGFKGTVVDVNDEGDRALLEQLKSEDLQQGIRLGSSPQPALVPLSRLAIGLTKALASRRDAIRVQEFRLGLDFSDGSTPHAKLAEGLYIAVQIPDKVPPQWDWSQWMFYRHSLIHREESERRMPYNYLVFRVSRNSQTRGDETELETEPQRGR